MKFKKCPSKNEIIRFFEKTAPEGEERKLLAHVLACPECLAVFEAAEEIRSQSPGILRNLDGQDLHSREARNLLRKRARQEILLLRRSRRPAKRNSLRWAGVPAVGTALALLAVFVIVPNIGTRRTSGLERNASLLEIGLLRPRGAIPASALSFKWTQRPEVQSYRLEIYDRSLEPVYQSGPLSSDTFFPPEDAAALIRINEVYFWKIVAVFKDSQTIESEFARFILQK
jgi:hypothetical protein